MRQLFLEYFFRIYQTRATLVRSALAKHGRNRRLTVGILSLAVIFHTCVDAFAYIRAGKSLERELEILLIKLEIEKTVWFHGEMLLVSSVGMAKTGAISSTITIRKLPSVPS